MARVRTTFSFGRERVVIIGEVDRGELGRSMKSFQQISKSAGLRPGQSIAGGDLEVSGDTMACIHAMSPDNKPLMTLDKNNVMIICLPKGLVYSSQDGGI